MAQENLNDLAAFLAVARARSFTKAAAQLGVSQSALSHTMNGLEARLGVRLLTRTTRSVSPTEAGERLMQTLGPRLDEIADELTLLSEFRDKPSGTIRINAAEHAAKTIIWPKLERFLPSYPDIKVELTIEYGMVDIVAKQYDMGVRLGDAVAKDMIAVRIAPDMRMAVVATPKYFAQHEPPQTPQDLLRHNCINLRLGTSGNLYAWEFEKDGQALNVRVEGQLILNGSMTIIRAVLAHFGIAYVPQDLVQAHIDKGELIQVLADWCPAFSGYHIYYPSRKQSSLAFKLLVDALRYSEK